MSTTIYSGHVVDKLPKDPENGLYLCNGKIHRRVHNKWVVLETPKNFKFVEAKSGKQAKSCRKEKSSSSSDCEYKKPHKPCRKEESSSSSDCESSSSSECEPKCGEDQFDVTLTSALPFNNGSTGAFDPNTS
ncbi:hypothetical protein MEO93_27025, partial [Dolichospermum sp. ST_sed3]|nr:hypothetical protein [Dolichospermum sp. ST_sed3]